ncbi:MAG: hypothetical protein V4693_05625 [Pseudomonadota bacterium]
MLYRSTPVLLLAIASMAASAHEPVPMDGLATRALDLEVVCGAPEGWHRVDADALDSMRGGFIAPGGLTVSIGIERLVSINGAVVAYSNFQIANVRNITADEARQAHDALASAKLVQNGANNFAVGDALANGGTFIQNTLDGQSINSQTTINSSVNSASLLKEMHFQSGMRDAAIRAIGTH